MPNVPRTTKRPRPNMRETTRGTLPATMKPQSPLATLGSILVAGAGARRRKLSELGRLHCGQSPPSTDVNRDNRGTPYVTGPEHWDGAQLALDKWTTAPKRVVPPDCVFITVKGAGVGTVFPGVACAIGRDIYAFEPERELSARYLEHWLRFRLQTLIRDARGDIPGLSKNHILDQEIDVPAREEQDRIVAHLDELFSDLDAGVAALHRAKASLKRYRAAVLKAAVEGKLSEHWREANLDLHAVKRELASIQKPERPNRWNSRSVDVIRGHAALAVGNPGTPLPAGWHWVPLVDIARMESGHTPSRRHPEWWKGNIPWIGIDDARIHNGGIIRHTIQHTNADGLANSAARLLPRGTVCISRTASVGYVVTMARAMATSQDFVNWVPTPAVTSEWLSIIFQADTEALRQFGKGSVHKTIYFPEWLSMHIAIPPIAEQVEISRHACSYAALAQGLTISIAAALKLMNGLRRSSLSQTFRQTGANSNDGRT